MTFRLMIHDPKFPKDKSKAKALSKEQFDVVHDYLIACMNDRKSIEEAQVLAALDCAGLPLFTEEPTP